MPLSKTGSLIIIICAGVLVLASVLFFVAYEQMKDERLSVLRTELLTTAPAIAAKVDGDTLLTLETGDEGTPEYMDIVKSISSARANNTHIIYAYTMRVDNGSIRFGVDDVYGSDTTYARIGELYDTPDKEKILQALNTPAVSDRIYSDRWGSFMSGYAPIRDHNGTAVAVLGIDISADFIIAYENSGLYHFFDYF